ncbi:uncharacterized protein V3H82_027574 [Fundulus diaphanus]
MLVLELVLIVVLQFEGTRGGELYLYHRSGDDVVLPCNSSSSSYSCSIVNWFYFRDPSSSSLSEVQDGKVNQSSPRAARLNVDSKCSLIINNITAEDAGAYACRFGSGTALEGRVLLSVLTVSPSPTGADPSKEDFSLKCSLERFRGLGPCPEKSLLWVDETGSELLGEGVGFKSGGQTGCDSYLTVKLQISSSNRRYTCQFVEGNTVKIEAHYPSEIQGVPDKILIFIILGAVIGVLLLGVLVAVFIKLKKTRVIVDHRTKTEDQESAHESHQNEVPSDMIYANVDDFKPQNSSR